MTTPKRSHLQAMAEKLAILVTKLLVAGACSWHVPRRHALALIVVLKAG